MEVHRNSLPDKDQCSEERGRQQNPKQTAGYIYPEISQRLRSFPRQSSHKCDTHREARGSGQKVLRAETHHLAEIAHGVFSPISLPCCGRRETDRGIEGQIRWGRGGEVFRKEPGKKALASEDQVEKQGADETEYH